MRVWVPMIILILAVTALCIWDGIYTNRTFNQLNEQVEEISDSIKANESFENLATKINDLNEFWTDKMDVLCLSISKKDLQPVSDYIQYLRSAIENENKEDCLTYSLLLAYNVEGLSEANGISLVNLL